MTRLTQFNLLASGGSKLSHVSSILSKNRLLSSSGNKRKGYVILSKLLVVFFFFMMQTGSVLLAQEIEVQGKVTAASDGTPLVFANIVVQQF